ncbi:PREDICTED: uncharacterized protein LOC109580500 [Amphimedon queenslandica]|uniref:Uncharacterized protein n=1 Tax=Amphimedon queenslandica TaxID=400682 RepID=A0A1X7VE57_AMPQE|nr:PREDICTED: uncharacterized protein LOC109580500 [Amphimedon queenslandica]XP_019849307.1 PREDICTED: uncharacterized protein LOC109580500 [Amphimedon queenslandica]|eukprot:XP_019849306.1 PREDICTED: uncharacterized protein LOC109580500 [Amphimedon queenslandica]
MSFATEEKKLVVRLLFGIVEVLESKTPDEAVNVVEDFIPGITRAITKRPNGIDRQIKLDYLLPMLLDLVQLREGFINLSSFKAKFDQIGVALRAEFKNFDKSKTDPIAALDKLLKIASPETVPLPLSPPPERSSLHFTLPPPNLKDEKLAGENSEEYCSAFVDSPAPTESSCSLSSDGEDRTKVEQQTKASITESILYTFPYDVTPGIIDQLQSIADYSNCIMTPVKTFQGTSFFINAAKEWDRRKCIDGFHDFERKHSSKKFAKMSSLPTSPLMSPSRSPTTDNVKYHRSHLLQIKRNLRTESPQLLESLYLIGQHYDILM